MLWNVRKIREGFRKKKPEKLCPFEKPPFLCSMKCRGSWKCWNTSISHNLPFSLLIPDFEIVNSGTGREWTKSIPKIREREGKEKKTSPKFGKGKGMKNPFPKFGNGNKRPPFSGMTGNRNSRSPLLRTESYCVQSYFRYLSEEDSWRVDIKLQILPAKIWEMWKYGNSDKPNWFSAATTTPPHLMFYPTAAVCRWEILQFD